MLTRPARPRLTLTPRSERAGADEESGEYTIERDGQRVAEVSKQWFRVRDTYGIETAPGENDVLMLATAAVIDTMAHPDR